MVSEIPSGQILLQRHPEGNGIGVAAVGIAPLPPKGRQLHRAVPRQNGDGAVLHPGLDHPAALQQLLGLPGQGVGGHIPVVGLPAQQQIPDAAADRVGRKARLVQGF